MGRGIFNGMLDNIEAAGEVLSDNRREGFNLSYKLTDALKCALSVFFFQHPSMLDFQQKMKEKLKRNNLESIMGVKEIPSNVQITALLDGISPDSLSGVFNENLHVVDGYGSLKDFRCLDGGVLGSHRGTGVHRGHGGVKKGERDRGSGIRDWGTGKKRERS